MTEFGAGGCWSDCFPSPPPPSSTVLWPVVFPSKVLRSFNTESGHLNLRLPFLLLLLAGRRLSSYKAHYPPTSLYLLSISILLWEGEMCYLHVMDTFCPISHVCICLTKFSQPESGGAHSSFLRNAGFKLYYVV